jgi:hypothetical protein
MGSPIGYDSLPEQSYTAYGNRYYRADLIAAVIFITTGNSRSFIGKQPCRTFSKSRLYIHNRCIVFCYTLTDPHFPDRFNKDQLQQFLAALIDKHYTFFYYRQVVASFPHIDVSCTQKRTIVQVHFQYKPGDNGYSHHIVCPDLSPAIK